MLTDVQAGPSPATVDVEIPNPETMSPQDRAKWMETGEFTPPSKEKPSGAADPGKEEPAESGAAPDAAAKDKQAETKPESRAERRIRRLNEDNKRLAAEIESLRGTRTEQRTPPAAETKTNREAPPKYKDFVKFGDDAWDKYEEKLHAYNAEQRKLDLQEALAQERETLTQKATEEKQAKDTEQKATKFAERARDFRKTLKDDDFPECMQDVIEMTNGHSHLSEAILESEFGPQLVKYFGDHPEELAKLTALSVRAGLRELVLLEISERIKGPAVKTKTAARKIGSDVDGHGAVVLDDEAELEAALTAGDGDKYNRIMQKREAAERRR